MLLKTYCPYRVGDYYITGNAGDPSATWPDTTWQQITDTMLMAAGSTYVAGTTGGAATHSHTTGSCTLTSDQIPSHTHSVGAHAHGLNSHTHGLNSHTHSYSIANGTGSTAITEAQLAKHNHPTYGYYNPTAGSGGTRSCISNIKITSDGANANYSDTGSNSGHTHTTNTKSATSGQASGSTAAASGNTANSTAFNSGSTGGGRLIRMETQEVRRAYRRISRSTCGSVCHKDVA